MVPYHSDPETDPLTPPRLFHPVTRRSAFRFSLFHCPPWVDEDGASRKWRACDLTAPTNHPLHHGSIPNQATCLFSLSLSLSRSLVQLENACVSLKHATQRTGNTHARTIWRHRVVSRVLISRFYHFRMNFSGKLQARDKLDAFGRISRVDCAR